MPYHWVRVPSSPPQQRRDDVAGICLSHGGRLVEGQIFYDAKGKNKAWALVETPADEAQRDALLQALHAIKWTGLVDADEEADGKAPPPSRGDDGFYLEEEIVIEEDEEDPEAS
jgi:hypothetical protein